MLLEIQNEIKKEIIENKCFNIFVRIILMIIFVWYIRNKMEIEL